MCKAYTMDHAHRRPTDVDRAGAAFWLAQTPPQPYRLANLDGPGLVMVIWASTALLQIPLHNSLGRGLDVEAIQKLSQGIG